MKPTMLLGALAPLSEPGLVAAGQELVAGMELAAGRLNVELRVVDTKGTPAGGLDAVARLSREGVHAIVGEYHSIVVAALVHGIERRRIPFVCASATLDTITAERRRFVFRIAPPQSYGWRVYAEFLTSQGIRHVVAALQPDIYWSAGAAILQSALERAGTRFTAVPLEPPTASEGLAAELQALSGRDPTPDAVLLLVGSEPLGSILGELAGTVLLGDPAGRPALVEWRQMTGVPFLAYEQPGVRTGEGRAMEAAFERRYSRRPSFVAFEGYDAVLAVHAAAAGGTEAEGLCAALREVEVEGTRARFRFSTEPAGVVHQQWAWPPVSVLARRRSGEFELLWEAEGEHAHV